MMVRDIREYPLAKQVISDAVNEGVRLSEREMNFQYIEIVDDEDNVLFSTDDRDE